MKFMCVTGSFIWLPITAIRNSARSTRFPGRGSHVSPLRPRLLPISSSTVYYKGKYKAEYPIESSKVRYKYCNLPLLLYWLQFTSLTTWNVPLKRHLSVCFWKLKNEVLIYEHCSCAQVHCSCAQVHMLWETSTHTKTALTGKASWHGWVSCSVKVPLGIRVLSFYCCLKSLHYSKMRKCRNRNL